MTSEKRKNFKFGIILLAFGGLIFSGYKIASYIIDSNRTRAKITELESLAELSENGSTNDERSAEEYCEKLTGNRDKKCLSEEEENLPSLYWKFLSTPFLSVNLESLKQQNPDTIGWIQVLNTNINFPFVQASDNSYYLEHSFDKAYNSAGWAFLDYRNPKDLEDRNNIIYAHGRFDLTMFGTIKNMLNEDWIKNDDNLIVRTATENNSKKWQIFSIYTIPTTSDYLKTKFSSDTEAYNFFKMLKSRSRYEIDSSLSPDDTILTLSTCYNDVEKLVVHARLISTSRK